MPGPFAPQGLQPILSSPSFREPGDDVGTEDDIKFNRQLMDDQLETILRWLSVNPVLGQIAKSESPEVSPGPAADPGLAEEIKFLFSKLVDVRLGLPFEMLTPLIEKYGAETVGLTLKSMGKVTLSAHRVYITDVLSKAFGTAFTSSGGFQEVSADKARHELPPGTKKLWNDRIMQKGRDGKWHMLGKAGHSKAPKKPAPAPDSAPDAAPGQVEPRTQLSREEAADMIRKMIRLHHAARAIKGTTPP